MRRGLFGLLLLVPAPSLGVLASMWLWPRSLQGSAIYAVAKTWILLLPLLWWFRWERGRQTQPAGRVLPTGRSVLVGLGSGIIIAGSIVGAYWLIGRHWIDVAAMRTALEGIGLGDRGRFLGFAVMVCVGNSWLEEYVWRWFVVRRGEDAVGEARKWWAVWISAGCFTLHHIVATLVYFDVRTMILACTGVFLGGLIWSWLFARYRNIWPGWISHVIADVAVMGVGWHIMFGF